jgi:D-alanyl-D-alanine carboxypeptidase/D-alanyl-D-alanine-endopeptidase (penicillin-binding protein 4)
MFPSSSKTPGRSARTLLPALVLLVALALPTGAGATSRTDVKRAMTRMSGAHGGYAYNVTKGRAVAGVNQGTARILASNTKLFTGASVLARFGDASRFSTSVYATGPIVGGVLDGKLYLRGGGDPLFGTKAFVTDNYGSRATLENLADAVRAAGVTKITGGIVADQTAFDSRRGTAYSGYRISGDIGAQLGALIVNKGWASGKYQSDPARYAAQQLRGFLRKEGISVASATSVGGTPVGAARVAFVRSLPMYSLVRLMNKPSSNYLAEMLLKDAALSPRAANALAEGGQVPLGATSSSTARGAKASQKFAASLGSKVKIADGSGLSRSNKGAPREVVDLLRRAAATGWFPDLRDSLPIAGVDGTLYNRMKGTAAHKKCQAKTGTLSNVATLSGYCTAASGDLIAFSLLQNKVSPATARAQQDRVTAAIAGLR